jgi:hypothetical protein
MFERFKKFFSVADAHPTPALTRQDSQLLADWARQQGFAFTNQPMQDPKGNPAGEGFVVKGQTQGKPWQIECGVPNRDFIQGRELRGRCDLGVLDAVSVVLMNRPLKVTLEKRAYALYTDSLQTMVDPQLPEEMRWLAVYQEVGWERLPSMFLDRYAVLAGKREHAMSWLTTDVAQALMSWPPNGPSSQVPFVMMLLRGKCYFRMEYRQVELSNLQHVVKIYNTACESALHHVAQSTVPESR